MPRDLFTGQIENQIQGRDLFETFGAEKPKTPKTFKEKGFDILGTGTGLGTAGAGAYGVYKGAKSLINWYKQPKLERNALIEQLTKTQKQLGIEGTKISLIPKKISGLQRDVRAESALQTKLLNNRTNQAIGILKQRLNDFDNTLLSSNVEDLSNTIKTQYPQWAKSGSEGYGAGLEAAEMFMADKGKTFNTLDFQKNIINKTIDMARNTGSLDDELMPLLRLQEKITPKTDIQGFLALEKQISLREAKGYIQNLIRKDPYGKISGALRENWGNFLEQNAPKEIKQQLTLLNKEFKPFAEARTKIAQLSNPRTGEFDTKGLVNYFRDYAKKKIDTGTKNLMQLLSEGNQIVEKMPEVKEKFGRLETLKTQRAKYEQAPLQANISRKARLNIIAQKAKEELDRLTIWQQKSETLISKARVAQAKVNKRSLMAKIPYARGMVQKGLPILGISAQIFDAKRYAEDPEGYLYQMETGQQMPPKGEEREKWRKEQLMI